MATPQQRRQFEKQKRDLQRKQQELNRQEERVRQGQTELERDRRAMETEKREWKNKKAKLKNELSSNRPRASPATSPRRGGGGGPDPMTQRKMQKMAQELERLKREMGAKNEEIRSLRKDNKNLARDLRVLKKQLAGKTGKVTIVDHTHITKSQINRLKMELKRARKKIHKLLDSIRVRKRYYGKHINKFKKGENRYIRERAATFKREKVVTKYLFADRVNKVKLSRGKRDRVVLSTDDGEVVLRPVQVVVVPDGGVGDMDDPEEILRELGDLEIDDEDMTEPPDDDDEDEDSDEDEDAKVDDAELEAEIQAMLDDPEYANENGEDDEDDPVYGRDNFTFPDVGGSDDDAKDRDPDGGDGDDDEVKSPGDQRTDTLAPTLQDATSEESAGQGPPYHVGDKVVLKNGLGIVRYIGPTPKSKGADVFGIELIDGSVGKHNGTYQGTTYFECPDKRGIFAKEDSIRRKVRPKDEQRLEQAAADRALNEERRHSTSGPQAGGAGASGKPNLMTFVIQESSKRTKDIDALRGLLEEPDAEAQNQGFGALMQSYQNRHADFIANLDALGPAQPDGEEFDDVRTYNSSFMNFVALLGNTMAGKALLESNSKQTLEYFLDELTARISDVHRLQDIHFELDDNPDGRSKEERCQALMEEIVARHQSEEDDLSRSVADNAGDIAEDFRSNNSNWRGAVMRTKQNQDQLEKLLRDFAARTAAISADIDGWKRLWEPPVPDQGSEQDGAAEDQPAEDDQADEPAAGDDAADGDDDADGGDDNDF